MKLYILFIIFIIDNALELEWVIPYQLNERPIELKRVRKQNLIRIFNKENSVFKPWKADTNKSLKLMFDLDISHSKIDKVIKDDEAYEDVKNVIFTNISKVKDVFTYWVGYSSYPLISWLDFSDFCQKWKIIDKNCSLADIDRIFIATWVSLEEGSEGKSNGLWRHQFYEIIVRIAKQKYFTPGITDSMSTAVDMILNQHILPHLSDYWEWQSWRYMELWDAKIDDFYKANMDSLKKIYAS